VKENAIMSTKFDVSDEGLIGYIKPGGDSSLPTTSDYQVQMEAPISKLTAPSGEGAPDEISTSDLGFTPQTGDPSFNSRGLPCVYDSGVCTTNVGFIYYFKDERVSGGGWAAISISPAGRIKRWFWSGSDWLD
jgi:hypothetical protein